VHYTAGVGTAVSLAGARLVPGHGLLSTIARLLLDGAGALFGLYLVLAVGLSVYGWMVRRRAGGGARPAGLPRPAPPRLPGPAVSGAAAERVHIEPRAEQPQVRSEPAGHRP
jgi:hypothetical protein